MALSTPPSLMMSKAGGCFQEAGRTVRLEGVDEARVVLRGPPHSHYFRRRAPSSNPRLSTENKMAFKTKLRNGVGGARGRI
mmetsp:Transcript_40768/g.130095  ORF Transcript_40768/g.130095 Transcript_40768/m.130095 type:complete len:81 (+) Transcript_40768:698-940(+)